MPLIKEPEVARDYQVTTRTIRSWRKKGLIPFIRLGKCVWYNRASVRKAVLKLERKEVEVA